jgi:hypothetical protein
MAVLRNKFTCIGLLFVLAGSAHGQSLVHRYSFISNANDEVGTANGTVVGGATFNGTALVLNGTNGYVSLPAGVVSNLTAVTIETWASFGTIANNSFLFGFGNTDGSGAGEDYIFCTPHGNGTRAVISGADPGYDGEQEAAISSTLDNQSNVMVATVFNPPAGFIGLYINGTLVASNNAVATTMASVSDKLSYIGHSLYTADPYLNAAISEFRIYNGALTNGQIAVDAAAGAGQVVSNPGLLVSIGCLGPSNVMVNTTAQLDAVGNFQNVTNVWLFGYGQPTVSSGNGNILTVNSAGVITALALGQTYVNVQYGGHLARQTVTVTFPTNRFVFDTYGDGFWTVTNALNGLPLTVNAIGSSQEAYTNGATDQQFELLYNYQNSTFRIRQRSSWQCIGSANGGTSPGTGVTTVNYSAQPSQQWYFVDAGNGLFRIVNAASDCALQTDNGNPATVTLATAGTGAAQLWGFSYQTHYPKKGCAGYEGDYAQFGLNWAFNYDDNTGVSLPSQVDFAPMVWGQYWEPVSDLQSRDPGWLAQPQPAYLMTFNEPDNSQQANMPVSTAMSLWPSLQALNVPLVGPAMQDEEDSWESGFYTAIATNGYRVDYSSVHLYVPPNSSSLISDLQSEYNAYGRPVWLTEFSPVDWSGNQGWTEDDDYNFLAEFMWMAEGDDWLKRYAIFPFSGTNPNPPYTSVTAGYRGNFFESDGATLTPYGELYAAWDGNTSLQTRTPYLIHNLGTSFRLTSTNSSSAPVPKDIYVRDATAQWALLPSPTQNQYYIISLNDGRRLRNNAGTLDLAPVGTTGSAVQWWMNGPYSPGYYYIDNVAASQSVRATGTAPAISFSMINDPAPSSATEWRLIKPYQPVTIVTPVPPTVSAGYGSHSVALTWSGNGSFYNVYRSTTSGGNYTVIARDITATNYVDNTPQNGTACYYVVTALDILGEESGYSAQVAAYPAATTPVSIGVSTSVSGGQNGIQVNWAGDHTGWRLLMNTNGLLCTNWIAVANSAVTNQMRFPFSSPKTVFFRLIYP